MATYLRHLKFQFGGTIGNPDVEIWSNTVNFVARSDDDPTQPSADFSSAQLDAALGALNAPLQAWFNSADAQISSVAELTWAKLNQIEANGKQRDLNTHRIDTGVVPGGSNLNVPWYQTYALTMRTSRSRGRGHAGRIFPPLVTAGLEGGGPYATAANVNRMATAFSAFLTAASTVIHNARGAGDVTPVYPVVASAASNRIGDTNGPANVRVERIVVDRVPDVQHRRTNGVPRLEGTASAVAGYGT